MNLTRNQLLSILLGITAVMYFVLSFTTTPMEILGVVIGWKDIWLGIAIGYLISSFRVWEPILPEEIGLRIILGVPNDELESGPPFAPIGIVTIEKTVRTTQQREFPEEPQNLFRPKKGGDETPPPGMLPPLRVTFAGNNLTYDQAILVFEDDVSFERVPGNPNTRISFDQTVTDNDGLANSRITAEVAHTCRLRIYNLRAFVQNIPPHSVTGKRIDEAFRQIEDEQAIVINTILTKMTVAQALRNLTWLNAVMFRRVSRRIGADIGTGKSLKWGCDLEGSSIKTITFNHGLNNAITAVGESSFTAMTTVKVAEGERQATIFKGQGVAQAAYDLAKKTLEGQAAGLAEVAKVASTVKGRAAIQADVARAIAGSGNTVIVGAEGVTQLLGLAAVVKKGDQK